MPPDLSVSAIAATANTGPVAPPASGQAVVVPPAPQAQVTATGPQFPNPSLRLDHGLGMVVIEFRDPGGQVTRSIPSQRQIDAYRSHQIDTLPGTHAAEPAPQATEDAPAPVKVDVAEPTDETA